MKNYIDLVGIESTNAGIPQLTIPMIRNLQIPLPPLKEQEKIARILGVWDSAIDSLANLIKAKHKYKTALMQRLLTPPRYTTSCHTDAFSCHTASSCHTERSEVSKNKGVELQSNAICLDSSLSTKAQNDKVLESCYDTRLCHTASFSCHTALSCHTERSEVSKNKGVELQGDAVCLDFYFMLFWFLRSLRSLRMTRKITE